MTAPQHLIETELREMLRYLPELQARRNAMFELEQKISTNRAIIQAFPHLQFPDTSKDPYLMNMLEVLADQRKQSLLECRISSRLLREYLVKLEAWEQSKYYKGPPTHPALSESRQSLLKELTNGTIATLLKEGRKHNKSMDNEFAAAIKLVSDSLSSLF